MANNDGTDILAGRFLRAVQSLERLLKLKPNSIVESLTVNQLRTLLMIRTHPGIVQKDIAERLSITSASVSVAIRQMEEVNLVTRQPDETDGRMMRLYLGETGREIVEEAEGMQLLTISEMLKRLTIEQQQQLVSLLERTLIETDHMDVV